MNTLEELNTYSNSQIPFEDDRSLIITAGNTTTTTQSVTVSEDDPVDLSLFGVTFSELRSLDNTTSDYITLEFDFSAASNPHITWPDKTAYVEGNTKYNNITFSNPSTGVFRAEHIQLNSDYLAVLANTEIVARDQTAAYSYTITVSWPGNTYSQQFDVTTAPAAVETNLNGLSLTARSLFAHLLFDPSLDPTPAVTDAAPGSIYELVLTSTAGATLGLTSGATPTVSVTIPGDRDAVNAALANVHYTALLGFYQQTDTINYSLTVTNPSQGSPYVSETGSFTNYVPAFAEVFGIVGRNLNSGADTALFASPTPTIEESLGVNNFQLVITTDTGEIKESPTTGSFGNSLTLTGSSSDLETAMAAIVYSPAIILGTTTDTLNYTLSWTTFELDTGTWEIDTTMNITTANLDGITITKSLSDVDDMFAVPLPVITETVDNPIELTITTTTGRIQESSSVGPLSNSLTLTGSGVSLTAALALVQYEPPVLQGTNSDSLSYTMSVDGTVLVSNSFTIETTIDTTIINLDGTGHTMTDITNELLFPANYNQGFLPAITSTDTSNNYRLVIDQSVPGILELNGNSSGIVFSGTPQQIETSLLAIIAEPLVQDVVLTIDFTLELQRDTNWIEFQSGTFTKVLPEFFDLLNMPSSITLEDQNDQTLFSYPLPFIVNNTTGYHNITFNLQSPGVFNQNLSTETYTGYVSPTGGDPDINAQLGATTYDPNNSITGGTEILSYDLVVNGITWISTQTISVAVPPEIEIHNTDNRSFVGNTVNSDVFLPAYYAPNIEDNLDPSRDLQLQIISTGGQIKTPHISPINWGYNYVETGTAAEINAILAGTVDPIGLIPDLDSDTITLEFIVKDALDLFTVLQTATISFNRTSISTLPTSVYTNNFSLSLDQYFYGAIDAVLVGAGGGAGKAVGDTNIADSGAGGDGAIVKFENYNLDNLTRGETNFVFDIGVGGSHGTNAGDNGAVGGNTVLSVGSTPGVASTTLYTAYGGGGGGGAFSYGTTSAGGPGYARNVIPADGPGGSGGAAVWVNDDDPENPYDDQALALGVAAGVGYATTTGQTPTRLSNIAGADGRIDSGFPRGGNSTEPSFIDDITGSNEFYKASGGFQDHESLNDHNGEDGEIVVKVKPK